jgi:ribosomal protein S28E/S33
MMKKKLKKADLHDFPAAAFLQFFRRCLALLLAAGPYLQNVVTAARINALQALVDRLADVLRWSGLTALTKQITEANLRLDHAFSEITAKVKGLVRFGDTLAITETAKRIQAMLKHYGKVKVKFYDDETGTVEIILENLNGPFAADVITLGIGGLRDALQAAYDKLLALLREREAAEGTRPKDPLNENDTFAKLRKEFAELYREIEEIINSGAALELSQEFGLFIDVWNPEIEHYDREFGGGRTSLKNAQIAPIPEQLFTGHPITVPVKVFVKTKDGMKELTPGTDFYATFKNNVEVGNAKCTVHGKGKYKGSQTITFAIERV